MKFIVENKRRKRVKESINTRNFTIEYVNYNDGFYDTTDTEDIEAASAEEAINKFKEDHDEEIVSVYDDSDIFYDIDTGIELDESKKVMKESPEISSNLDYESLRSVIGDRLDMYHYRFGEDFFGDSGVFKVSTSEARLEDIEDLVDYICDGYKRGKDSNGNSYWEVKGNSTGNGTVKVYPKEDDRGSWIYIDIDSSLDESLKLPLKEAFNTDFPDWVLNYLRGAMKGNRFSGSLPSLLKNQGIDLYAADFIEVEPPVSSRDPALKDTTRLALFDIVDDRGRHVMWTPAMRSDWGSIQVNSKSPGSYEFKKPEDMSWKWILDHTANYGYFDLSNAETTARDKRASRADAKKGSIERGLGQYHHKKYGTENEWQWLQSKGQDKSGYKLDPNKYSRMLDSVGLDNYADRLKSYYNKIEEVRSALVSIITDADLLKKDYRSKDHFSGNIIGDVHRAADYLSDAIENYKEIETSIDKWSSRGKLDDSMVSEIFKWNAPSLRRSLQDAVEYIKHMKSNPTYPKDED